MSDGGEWEPVLKQMLEHACELIQRMLMEFRDKLDKWLNNLLAGPIPATWREDLARFVDETHRDGLNIRPDGIAALEGLIQGRAGLNAAQQLAERQMRAAPIAKFGAPLRHAADGASETKTLTAPSHAGAAGRRPAATPARSPVSKPVPDRGQAFFDYQLDRAAQQLAGMQASLKRVQGKLSAARIGDSVDLEADADEINSLILGYNAAMESARQAWLDNDLSGDSNSRLMEMRSPVSLGLPPFTSESQRQRAAHQMGQIGNRLRQRDANYDRLVVVMTRIEQAGAIAGYLAGGAMVVQAGSKLAMVKVAGAIVAFAMIDNLAAKALRAGGASEQTINSIHFAAAIVGFILLRRSGRLASRDAAAEGPGAAGAKPTPAAEQPPEIESPPPTAVAEAPSAATTGPVPAAAETPAPAPAPVAEPPAQAGPDNSSYPLAKIGEGHGAAAELPKTRVPPAAERTPLPTSAPPDKPPLPPPKSESRFSWPGHESAALAEEQLARTIQALPDEVVVRWGDPIGAHGADVISVNIKSGQVTLWDSKLRSANVTIQPTKTFQDSGRLAKAIQVAVETIESNTTLPKNIRAAALNHLREKQVITRTVGAGNANNSTLQ